MELDPTGGPGDGLFPSPRIIEAKATGRAYVYGDVGMLDMAGTAHTGGGGFDASGGKVGQLAGESVFTTVVAPEASSGNLAKLQSYPFVLAMENGDQDATIRWMVSGFHPSANMNGAAVQGTSLIPTSSGTPERLTVANRTTPTDSKIIALATSADSNFKGAVLFDGLNGLGFDG